MTDSVTGEGQEMIRARRTSYAGDGSMPVATIRTARWPTRSKLGAVVVAFARSWSKNSLATASAWLRSLKRCSSTKCVLGQPVDDARPPLGAGDRGRVDLLEVVVEHSRGAEGGSERSDRGADAVQPGAREPVRVAVIEGGQDLLFEQGE